MAARPPGGGFCATQELKIVSHIIMTSEAPTIPVRETKLCRYCHKDIPKGARKCPECHSDQRNWIRRHPILTFILLVILAPFIFATIGSSIPVDLSRCLPVPDRAVEALSQGIEEGITVRGAQAVRSADHESLYFVAVDLQGAGINDTIDVALFATRSGIEDDNTVGFISVDAVADAFADWGASAGTNLGISQFQDGASEAEACTRSVLGG